MTNNSGRVIEAQPDYLRVSAHGEKKALALEEWAEGQLLVEKVKGNRPKPWRMMGYSGTHCGQLQYGRRDKRATIVDLIGDLAAKELTTVLPLGDHCTRFDLAATWRADPPDSQIGPNSYTMSQLHYREHPTSARPSRTSDGDGGWTTYIGHRQSESFFRIYDKGAEARAHDDKEGFARYENCWRFELEAKGSISLPLAEALSRTDDRERFTLAYLSTWLLDHGIVPPFPPTVLPSSSLASGEGPMRRLACAIFRRTSVRRLRGCARKDGSRLLWPH